MVGCQNPFGLTALVPPNPPIVTDFAVQVMGGIGYVTINFNEPMDVGISPLTDDFFITNGGMTEYGLVGPGTWQTPTRWYSNTGPGLVFSPTWYLTYTPAGSRLESQKGAELANFYSLST